MSVERATGVTYTVGFSLDSTFCPGADNVYKKSTHFRHKRVHLLESTPHNSSSLGDAPLLSEAERDDVCSCELSCDVTPMSGY